MLIQYVTAAMHQAHYEFLKNDRKFYGEIPSCSGVYATGRTLEECRDQLEEVLEEWIFFRIAKNFEVPAVKGIKLRIKETV